MKKLQARSDSLFFSRELSWLAFNERVLDQAENPIIPLLERLKFLCIVSSNLEEFFMVRIAQLHRRMRREAKSNRELRDDFYIDELLHEIRLRVLEQKTRQARVYHEVKGGLQQSGLHIEEGSSPLAREIFEKRILPLIRVVPLETGKALPHLAGGRLHILARHSKNYSLIEVPIALPRILIVKTRHVFLVDRLIHSYPEALYDGKEVDEVFSFKISRDAEIELDDETDDPILEIEEALKDRDSGPIVRFESDASFGSEGMKWLREQFPETGDDKFYQFNMPLDLKAFMQIYSIRGFLQLKANFPEPKRPTVLPAGLSVSKFFSVLDKKDIFLHQPFSSFDPVIELVKNAAQDPKVTRICQTLYRTSGKSAVIDALLLAAKAGKKVTVIVELKARFDEANNARMAKTLTTAGVRVIYSSADFKIHAKLTLVEKKLAQKTKFYTHVSTGNYHPKTARMYTDFSFLTSSTSIGRDARALFDLMENMDSNEDYSLLDDVAKYTSHFKVFKVSPQGMFDEIMRDIEAEIVFAKSSKPARIRAKMNGLVEPKLINSLYRASQAGVKIDLLVRGVCCLRPQVKGLSENIRVCSYVDKYLEHSRLFIFENGGRPKVSIASADWMPRNFFKRVEVALPISNQNLIDYLCGPYWDQYERDTVRLRLCTENGHYLQPENFLNQQPSAQEIFEGMEIPDIERFSKKTPVAAAPQG